MKESRSAARTKHGHRGPEVREPTANRAEVSGHDAFPDSVQALQDPVGSSYDTASDFEGLAREEAPEVAGSAVEEVPRSTGALSGGSTLGLLLIPTRFRRTPGAFPGAIQSLPPELPVTPLDPEVKIPDASFELRKAAGGRGFFL